MSKKINRNLIITVSIITLICSISFYQFQTNGSTETTSFTTEIKAYTDHDPIQILSDENFIDYGFEGEGTYDEPYLIENLRIINSTHKGIEINETSMHFIIRNCYIETDQKGILVRFAANWTVRIYDNILIDNNLDGIVVANTHHFSIVGNAGTGDHTAIRINNVSNGYIANNEHIGGENIDFLRSVGTHLSNTKDTVIYNNYFDSFNRGIYTIECSNLTIQQNYCVNSKEYAGLYLYYSHLNLVLNNTCISNVEAGILLYKSNFNVIKYNNISLNGVMGLAATLSGLNVIYHNDFVDNGFTGSYSSQGWDDTGDNLWCNLELKEGNYWSDLNTNVYLIDPGFNIDFYPLESPVSGEVIDPILEPTTPYITEYSTYIQVILPFALILGLAVFYSNRRNKKKNY